VSPSSAELDGDAAQPLPSTEALLAALPWPWLVIDGDRCLDAAPAAIALGLVREGRVRHAQLARAIRSARRSQQVIEIALDPTRDAPVPVHLGARCAPLGDRAVLVLITDRSEAQRVDDVRRDFVANVSHELKTPVGALTLLAEAVSDAADDPEAVRRFSARMQREADRLAQLINELIDLSRLQSDSPLSHGRLLAVRDLIAEAVDACRLAAAAAAIDILIAGEPEATLFGDREQVVMALRNLIDNAVKYSPPRTRVTVQVATDAESVVISVADQGIGIAAKDAERIFERFYRVDPARSRATGGTGLGLSIVKHVAANHGGDVAVWSVPGKGSTFTVRFPRQQPADPADDDTMAAATEGGRS
jgi:two-component system sensor histidine kinase SenX3